MTQVIDRLKKVWDKMTREDVALIDPEDYQLNSLVNERNYAKRVAMSVESNQINLQWTEDFDALPLKFCSLDKVYDKKKQQTNTYGIRVHEIVDAERPALLVSFISHTLTSFFHVWADNIETCQFWLDTITYKYVAEQPIEVFDEDTNVRLVSFWGNSNHGYSSTEKKILMLPWDENLEANYPTEVRDQLQVLHGLKPPILGGRIILMHGPPGAGKTSLIRTLASHWTKWCHTSIVTDPEVLFGMSSALMTVMTYDFMPYIDKSVKEEDAYHMIVIEDAGELLEKDAHGQGFARLLNMADGMLGQSTNLIVCITTNKPIYELHEAITRPGRCIANIHFSEFSRDEALEWLARYDANRMNEFTSELSKMALQTGRKSATFTLAELYHIVSQNKQVVNEKVSAAHGTYL